jgi:RNA polymerase sigma factor (sigma-70 family)
MTVASLGLVVHRLRAAAGCDVTRGLSDAELLEQFAAERSEAAFAAIVERYGRLVLGICRRVLGHEQDAEDAFHATFFILAGRAGSIRKRASLASWLHGVAYHVSRKARRAAGRRRKHERRAKKPESSPAPDLTWRELQTILEEEIGRLPETQRPAFVLCCLDGRSKSEAARLLGWKEGTVSARLARARKLLQQRLARRGVSLSAALAALALADGGTRAALPAALGDATVQAGLLYAAGTAAGGSMIRAAVLADAALATLGSSRCKIAVLVLLTAGVLTAAAGGVLQRGLRQVPPQVTGRQAVPAAQAGEASAGRAGGGKVSRPRDPALDAGQQALITLTGSVLHPDGRPAAGALVAVVGRPKRPPQRGEMYWADPQILAQGIADGSGRLRLRVPRPSESSFYHVAVLAAAPGDGLGWTFLDPAVSPADVTLHLPADQAIAGRLVDLQGQPAAGLQVGVRSVGPKDPRGDWLPFGDLAQPLRAWPAAVTTDRSGRFVLHGVGRQRAALVEVRGEGIGSRSFHVDAQGGQRRDIGARSVEPAHLLEGTVCCADTDKPVAHAHLECVVRHAAGIAHARADARGRFRLIPPAGDALTVRAWAPDGQPYVMLQKEIAWPRAAVRQIINFTLPRGVLVRGRVVETAAGAPVADASVQFYPRLVDNPYRKEEIVDGPAAAVLSGADGTFEIAVPPGPSHLLVKAPTADYVHQAVDSNKVHYGRPGGQHWYPDGLAALDLKPGAASPEIKIRVRRGVTVRGRLVGPDGKPVARAMLACRLRITPFEWHWRWSAEVRGGHFELHGCDRDRTYEAYFVDDEHLLGAVAQLAAKDAHKGPVVVRMVPCGSATARLLDREGKPAARQSLGLVLILTAGVQPSPEALGRGLLYAEEEFAGNLAWRYYRNLASDAHGRVRLPALIPGATYRVFSPAGLAPLGKDFTVASGRTTNLGDVPIVP